MSMLRGLYVVLFLNLCAINLSDGARILAVFPFAVPSHYFLGNDLLKGLADAGHDVTMISPFSDAEPPKNGSYRNIVLDGFVEEQKRLANKTSISFMSKLPAFATNILLNFVGCYMTENVLNHTNVQALLKSNEKFDVVIVQQFMNDALKALANHFDAHLVLFTNIAVNSWINHLVGNPSLPSFHGETMLGYPQTMSFFQRVQNTMFKATNSLMMNLFFYPKHNRLIRQYLPNPPDLNDVMYNISLVLANSHVSTSVPQPSVPCIVEIGGFNIKPPKKLPDDLQSFLDDATEGVIYFSIGSNLKSKDLPADKRDAILTAFGKRKEKILMKWEDEVLPGQPSNVKVGKWFPQNDILAHPNVRIFVSHGGFASTVESIYHAVPTVAIPITGDQHLNANAAEEAGYAIVIPYGEISEEKLTFALEEVTTNPRYRDAVRVRSKIMHDRQIKPMDNVVYWIEYVIRHNGAKHLRVTYLDLSWYQYYLLDVFGFIFVSAALFVVCVKKIFSYVVMRKRKSDKTKLKKSQ